MKEITTTTILVLLLGLFVNQLNAEKPQSGSIIPEDVNFIELSKISPLERITVAIETDKKSYSAKDSVVATLHIRNASKTPIQLKGKLVLNKYEDEGMSRIGPKPQKISSKKVNVGIGPGETVSRKLKFKRAISKQKAGLESWYDLQLNIKGGEYPLEIGWISYDNPKKI